MKKIATGVTGAIALLGGGTVAADTVINPYEDTGVSLQIEDVSIVESAGKNVVELRKDIPEVRLKKWDGDVDFGISYPDVKSGGRRAFLTDRMEWKDGKKEVHAYPLEATEQMKDGGFEIEVFLKEIPESNTFNFQIDGADELDFFYQPPLHLSPREGEMCVSTRCWDTNDRTTVSRAENIVGSYAVYHKNKRDRVDGGKNYATGKAFHIFRPKAIDSTGDWVWSELTYQDGMLTVTVPDKWLSEAAYPVRVDPTIGYTTQGASEVQIATPGTYPAVAFKAQDTPTYIINSISAYLRTENGPPHSRAVFFISYPNPLNSDLPRANTSAFPYRGFVYRGSTLTMPLVTMDLLTETLPAVPIVTIYENIRWFGVIGEGQLDDAGYIAYDSGGVSGDTADLPDSSNPWVVSTNIYSLYADYSLPPPFEGELIRSGTVQIRSGAQIIQ